MWFHTLPHYLTCSGDLKCWCESHQNQLTTLPTPNSPSCLPSSFPAGHGSEPCSVGGGVCLGAPSHLLIGVNREAPISKWQEPPGTHLRQHYTAHYRGQLGRKNKGKKVSLRAPLGFPQLVPLPLSTTALGPLPPPSNLVPSMSVFLYLVWFILLLLFFGCCGFMYTTSCASPCVLLD